MADDFDMDLDAAPHKGPRKPQRGHFSRPNSVNQEGFAQGLMDRVVELLNGRRFDSAEDIPQEAVITTFLAQMVAPSKNAAISVSAARHLAEIAGMTGKRASTEDLEKEIQSILDSAKKPSGPRKAV